MQRDIGPEREEPLPPRFASPFEGVPEDPRRERLELLSCDPFESAPPRDARGEAAGREAD